MIHGAERINRRNLDSKREGKKKRKRRENKGHTWARSQAHVSQLGIEKQ